MCCCTNIYCVAQLVSEKEGLSGSGGVGGIRTLVQCDLSEAALVRARQSAEELPEEQRRRVTPHFLQVFVCMFFYLSAVGLLPCPSESCSVCSKHAATEHRKK